MKKIIDGKMYNTETATVIDSYSNCLDRGNFRWYEETLYRKANREFFLYGEGGALSRYAHDFPGGSCGGERIVPMSDAEAREWLENYGDCDIYVNLFGEPEE